MYHLIRFSTDLILDLEISRKKRLERLGLPRGARMRTQVRPYVTETSDGFVEMADLFFEDGTAARGIPFACFSFVD